MDLFSCGMPCMPNAPHDSRSEIAPGSGILESVRPPTNDTGIEHTSLKSANPSRSRGGNAATPARRRRLSLAPFEPLVPHGFEGSEPSTHSASGIDAALRLLHQVVGPTQSASRCGSDTSGPNVRPPGLPNRRKRSRRGGIAKLAAPSVAPGLVISPAPGESEPPPPSLAALRGSVGPVVDDVVASLDAGGKKVDYGDLVVPPDEKEGKAALGVYRLLSVEDDIPIEPHAVALTRGNPGIAVNRHVWVRFEQLPACARLAALRSRPRDWYARLREWLSIACARVVNFFTFGNVPVLDDEVFRLEVRMGPLVVEPVSDVRPFTYRNASISALAAGQEFALVLQRFMGPSLLVLPELMVRVSADHEVGRYVLSRTVVSTVNEANCDLNVMAMRAYLARLSHSVVVNLDPSYNALRGTKLYAAVYLISSMASEGLAPSAPSMRDVVDGVSPTL